ncbi:MAG: hypothetical protein C0469_16660 [Cyanobacteria bacterium DS2.3.42]|nr:hypothetical protein [Cyanobacteria bacterium DS2.3.42]
MQKERQYLRIPLLARAFAEGAAFHAPRFVLGVSAGIRSVRPPASIVGDWCRFGNYGNLQRFMYLQLLFAYSAEDIVFCLSART